MNIRLNKLNNRSGVMLIVVIWVLVGLSLMALGIGRQARIDLNVTRYFLGKMKSKYVATSGVTYAVHQIRKDNADKDSSAFDNRYQCGFTLTARQAPEELFKDINSGGAAFDITFQTSDGGRYGFEDEESRFNLNALDASNERILTELIVLSGYDESKARSMTSAVLDWIDGDEDVYGKTLGAEKDYYASRKPSYPVKNAPLESVEELAMVRGFDEEAIRRLRELVTIFPASGPLRVNLDTAPEILLQAMANAFSGAQTNTTAEDARSMTRKVLEHRRGTDNREATVDDQKVDDSEMQLNAREWAIYQHMMPYATRVSRFIRVSVQGRDGKVTTDIEAVIDRSTLSVVYWHRN